MTRGKCCCKAGVPECSMQRNSECKVSEGGSDFAISKGQMGPESHRSGSIEVDWCQGLMSLVSAKEGKLRRPFSFSAERKKC